jgi:ABC-type polysaccharide/polyol phosphate transport system ATPase subunit
MGEVAIVVEDLWKKFRIFHERNTYLKAAVLRGRRARYEEFWALKGVNITVHQGEVVAIIGENGSGKSTLLKCLARILRPDRGRVQVTGRLSALLELGAGFHPDLSGRENVYLNAAILGLPRKEIERRFDEIVGFAGLEKFIDMPVRNYSSGMYVRLGFAVAINVDPEVLVIDEVLAVGDASFQRRCMDKFDEFRDQGRTLVIVTHSLGSIEHMCDRAYWLRYGMLEREGLPAAVAEEYAEQALGGAEAASTNEARFGSGEVLIVKVQILGPDGRPATQVRTGDDVAVRMDYEARVPVTTPVFSVEVAHSTSGVVLASPTTRDVGLIPPVVSGPGVVEVCLPRLTLLPGMYELTVACTDFALQHEYDHRSHVARLDVQRGEPSEEKGLISLNPSWRLV